MKRCWIAGLLLVAGSSFASERITQGNLVMENIPEIPSALAERMHQYQNTRAAGLASWDPSGEGMLIGTRFGNTAQVHHVAAPGTARRQLTFYDEPVRGASFPPDPAHRGFVFSRDVGGGEFHQLYWFDLNSGRAELMTDGSSRNGGVVWSQRGDRFVYSSTRRNGRDHDLYLVELGAATPHRMVHSAEGYWGALDWSPDDRQLIIYNYVSATDSTLHILDLTTGERQGINPKPRGAPTIAYGSAQWARDGRGIYFSSDEDSEFSQLRYWNLARGSQTVLTGGIPWDVEGIDLSKDGELLAFTVNEGGRSTLHLLETATGVSRAVEGLPLGVIGGLQFSPDDRRLGFTLNGPQTPGDVYALRMEDGKVEQWTHSEVGGLDVSRFVRPRLISYETFDEVQPGVRRRIPAILYQPNERPSESRHPVVINVHGGPESQSSTVFSPLTQYMVNELGMAVIFPNVRGSTGYGKSYVQLDNGLQREDSVRDIGALLDWIKAQPELDPDRVAIIGGSYGGYMVLASMVHFNDRLAAGVDVVGIGNFVTFLRNTQDYRRDLRRAEYGDERDPKMRAFLERISPLNHIDRVAKPLMVVQGYNDPRVPVSEAEQIVAALKQNEAEPWYLLAMDEGHGFSRKANADFQQQVMMRFLEQHLLGR